MPVIQKLAVTQSADVMWDGRLYPCVRVLVEGTLREKLSDETWHQFCRVVVAYAYDLSHEYSAVPLHEQVAAVDKALKALAALDGAIETVETPEMGRVFTNLVADKWEEIRGRESAYDRSEIRMVADIAQALQGFDPDPEGTAWRMIRGWRANGDLERPSPASDFRVLLWEAIEATKMINIGLRRGDPESHTLKNDSFVRLVGMLAEWAKDNGIVAGATRLNAYDKYGRLVYLVKAVLEQVPELIDVSGKPLEKQLRRRPILDESLADAVIAARAAYAASRPPVPLPEDLKAS